MKILEGLFQMLRTACKSLPDKRTGKNTRYSMADIGMAAFSLFFMQNESFLQHQRLLESEDGESNCRTLFGMENIPTDNHIRNMLDGVPPDHFNHLFEKNLRTLDQENALSSFRKLDGHILIALDGTEHFSSYDIHCDNCSHRERSNGKTEYHHTFLGATIVAPGHNQVIPLPPEFVTPQDGHEKQDCESCAARRWLQKHGATYAPYQPIYLGDDLFAKQPLCKAVQQIGGNFIFTCKPDSHKTIIEYLQGTTYAERIDTVMIPGRGKRTYHYRWVCGIPIRDSDDAMDVNWFEITISDGKGKVTYHNSYVTDLDINHENIAEVAACGRSRWKIENETFNVLKNNGYHLEHNFGHGSTTLASVLVVLNLLAFAFHTTCDLAETLWQSARESWKVRHRFFWRLWSMTTFRVFSSWDELMRVFIGTRSPRRAVRSG